MLVIRKTDALADFAGRRIEDDDFARFARGDKQAAIGRQRKYLRSESGKFHGATDWREHLVDGGDRALGVAATDALGGGAIRTDPGADPTGESAAEHQGSEHGLCAGDGGLKRCHAAVSVEMPREGKTPSVSLRKPR